MTGFRRADAGVTDACAARRADNGAALMHDVNHLLGALRRYSELMSTPGVLSDEYGHLAQELQVLSDRSAAMLGCLVPLGSETALASEAAPAEVTVLPEAVLDCLGLLSKIAGRAVTFFCSPSAYLPVAVSRSGFERILVNLAKNAAEAGPGAGTVAVTLVGMREVGWTDGGVRLVLTVEGRGRGVGLGRMKEPTAGRGRGADLHRGIGFQVVRELAESSGAKVEIETEPDAGWSVSVRWPVMDPGRERRTGAATERRAGERSKSAVLPEAVCAELLAGGGAC